MLPMELHGFTYLPESCWSFGVVTVDVGTELIIFLLRGLVNDSDGPEITACMIITMLLSLLHT